jgi:hypothetical protein
MTVYAKHAERDAKLPEERSRLLQAAVADLTTIEKPDENLWNTAINMVL